MDDFIIINGDLSNNNVIKFFIKFMDKINIKLQSIETVQQSSDKSLELKIQEKEDEDKI
jgi:hypothetical protein